MNSDLEKYQCQIALPNFGKEAQQKLQSAKVLIIGMGGLGCPAAQYLASSGIGVLAMADHDVVSLSNLHRQILYSPEDIGKSKVQVAATVLQKQNPDVKIIPIQKQITSDNIMRIILEYDIVIDGTDNFATKYLINDACVLSKKPVVYGAVYQHEGQVSIWNSKNYDATYSANYRDVFPEIAAQQIPNCREGGVLPSLVGMVGCMQATETIKYLINDPNALVSKLWMINMQSGKTQLIKLPKKSTVKITGVTESISTISYQEFLKNKSSFELIDIRSCEEHLAKNIGGKNIPASDLESFLCAQSLSSSIIFYCTTGKRSWAAVSEFKKKFPKIHFLSLENGIQDL